MPEKTAITDGFTAAPGLAAPALRCDDWLFVSGQAAVSEDGVLVAPGDPLEQARLVVDAVARLCAAAGGTLDDVVHMNVLTADAAAIEPVLDLLRDSFGDGLPALLAGTFAAPVRPGVAVTIQATARLGDGKPVRVPAAPGAWAAAAGVPAACRKGEYVFLSGQTALDAQGHVAAPGDHCGQARAAYGSMLGRARNRGWVGR